MHSLNCRTRSNTTVPEDFRRPWQYKTIDSSLQVYELPFHLFHVNTHAITNVHACIQYVSRTASRNGATLSGQLGRLEHLFTPYVHLRLKLFETYNSNEDRIERVS